MAKGLKRHFAGLFIWSSYWGTWSKIIKVDNYQVTEVDLTPVNPHWESSWQCMLIEPKVREHCTALSPKDDQLALLPWVVVCRMLMHLDEVMVLRLLNYEVETSNG